MAVITEIRKSFTDSTPVLAVVGATDAAVERFRKVAANASSFQAEVTANAVKAQDELEKAVAAFDPAAAVSRALELAGKVEGVYESLAARGKKLVDRVESQQATQELIAQGRSTVTRTRAAVTTARKAVDETTSAARGVVTAGLRGAQEVSDEVVGDVEGTVRATERAAEKAVVRTRTAAKRTSTTARKRAVSTRSATKGVATSARKTATKAASAAHDAAKKVGG